MAQGQECVGRGQLGLRGHHVRMRPQGFAGLATAVCLHQGEDGRCAASLTRAHLQSHESPQDLFGGTARGAPTAHHFPQCIRVGQVGHGGLGRDDLDPALDEGEHCFQARQGTALVRRCR